ncbi:MAG: glycosyltransferase family 2 protein [Granulosicoccus sp.]
MPAYKSSESFTVSVIIPTHNRLTVLERAITSVVNQTFDVHEIVVVDDGSTDETSMWLAQHGAPLTVITQGNRGVSHARNRGIEKATGRWIALLDSDDFWHPEKIAIQKQALETQADSRFCHCDELWVRNGKRVNQKHKHQKHGGHIFEHCLPLCAISPSAVLIHRDVFAEHGLFDESLPACEDYDLWLRVCAHEAVTFVDKPLLTKTGGHEDQLSHRFPIMDRFRLQSLAKILRGGSLDKQQTTLAYQTFLTKLHIVKSGARKHSNDSLLHALETDYSDLLPEQC